MPDWLDLQRLITALIMPLPLGLGLMLLGLIMSQFARRSGRLLIGGGIGVIGLAALPPVALALMASLENDYPPQAADACHPAEVIVLLGGAVQPLVAGELHPRLHRGSDRVREAARLYHAGCAPRILVSAGGTLEPPLQASESDAIAALLEDLGVPRAALILEAESRNTQGNAAFSRAVLESAGIDRILLVTSAWHLRRAVALFEQEGFEVHPVGADYRSFPTCRGLQCWVPNAIALEATELALKEYLGYLVQVSG